jgi:hypothetical protein
MTALSTNTNYKKPYRPLPIKILNGLGMGNVHKQFDPDLLMAKARKQAGGTELSSAPLMRPLKLLCSSLIAEANLSPFGRIVQQTRLKGLLVNRLRLDALMAKHPDILAQPDPDVILIAGLARTGTTFLHRALSADPGARTLPSWEALAPAPLPGEPAGDTSKRIARGRSANKVMKWLAPDFTAVHPVSAEAPEEDILLLDLTMMSQTAEAVSYVPSYSAWLERQDHRPAYAYLRDVMKVLQWLRPGKGRATHWVLKSPHHAEQLGAALDIFPKATTLITHRDPMVTTASCSSLMWHTHALSTDTPDAVTIAHHWLRKSGVMASNTIAARKANPDRKFLDIHYADLIKDPSSIIKQIYAAHGAPLRAEGASAVVKSAQNRPDHTGGKKHVYALADFGLTEQHVKKTFAQYYEYYQFAGSTSS